MVIAFALASFVYLHSFSVKPSNADKRELAAGGHSGNLIYDWFIGRELNPRITIPIINATIDIKAFCELRPGLIGWILLNTSHLVHQYTTYGHGTPLGVTDSMLLVWTFQLIYVFDALRFESAILTTMDITTDGFGFMLAFGDLVWVPFIYSFQTRYLAVHPVELGILGSAAVVALEATGFYMFRSSNSEKDRFRTDPDDPRVAHLEYIETASGSKLLVSGWWGTARHINYLADWLMAWAWCLPTGIAGYTIGSKHAGVSGHVRPDGDTVWSGDARGYGMIFTYFYVIYFGILLVHRERRDENKCRRKYGADWDRYVERVPSRIIPGVY